MPVEQSRNEKILELALKRFRQAEEAERRDREEALNDLRFRAGDQWDEEIRRQRDAEKRPCLTLDRIGQFVRQVVNEIRQNRPAIQVSPVDDGSDKETAEIIQGLMRHIEQATDADVAYTTAAEYAATMGFGFFRIRADYSDPMSFEQDIIIEPVPNPFACYLDPSGVRAEGSDSKWGFIFSYMDPEAFRQEHPDAQAASGFEDLTSAGDRAPGWLSEDGIRVAEYFRLEYEDVEIAEVAFADPSNGTVIRQVIPLEKLQTAELPPDAEILNKRRTRIPRLKWAKITAVDILEERDLPGYYVPLLRIVAEELNVDGQIQRRGVVRAAKDSQRQYNYMATAETEAIALAPRAPFIAAEGQLEGYEDVWQTANTVSHAFLPYRPKSLDGTLVPPPARQNFEPAIVAISNARQQAAADMNAATGIYDAALGARSNETSGTAILARQREGDVANYHISDNTARAIKHCARILMSWIPVYYDRERVVRVIGEGGTGETVTLNRWYLKNGEQKLFDVRTGKYDVSVSVGPSYATKRQEAVASMSEFARAVPQLVPRYADIYARAMDWPYAQQIAERIVPPDVAEKDKEKQPNPQADRQKLEQMGQVLEQMSQELQQVSTDLKTKRLELESAERIAALKARTDLIKTLATLESTEARTRLQAELSVINQQIARVEAVEASAAEPTSAGQPQPQQSAAAA